MALAPSRVLRVLADGHNQELCYFEASHCPSVYPQGIRVPGAKIGFRDTSGCGKGELQSREERIKYGPGTR